MRTHRTWRLTALVASLAITACGGSSGTDAPPKSGDATLAALAVSAGSISPVFAPAVTSYALVAPHGTATLTVTPTAASAAAHVTVAIDGGTPVAVASGSASAALAVPAVGGSAAISLVVNAEDGVTKKAYGVTLTQAPSSDARLSGLAVSAGSLSPTFATGTLVYALVVPFGTASVTLTPAAADSAATVAVSLDGGAASPLVGGQVTVAVPAVGASKSVALAVTAPDALTTRTYAVTLTQAASADASLSALVVGAGTLTPAFAPAQPSYAVTVPFGVTTLGVTPTASDSGARISVAQDGGTPVPVASGSATSVAVPAVGNGSSISIVVTAQDGTTVQTYTVALTQDPGNDAALSALTLNGTSPAGFSPSALAYAFGVPNGAPTVAVVATPRDPLASSVSVNGQPGVGGASVPVALAAGAATVTVVVTAHDGVTQATYTVNVSEAPPTGLVNARAVSMDPSPLLTVAAGATLPENAAVGVPIDTLLRIGFDAPPTLGASGNIVVHAWDGTSVDTIALADDWAAYNSTTKALDRITTKVNVLGKVNSGIDKVRVVNYVPVAVSGNTVVIFPHNNRLAAGQQYYVTIDPGVITGTIGGGDFGGLADASGWSFTTKGTTASGADLYVAADGTADFATLQGAIDAVPAGNTAATTIHVAAGVYQELLYLRNKSNVTIQGADAATTIVQYDNSDGLNPGTGGEQSVSSKGPSGSIPSVNVTSGGRAIALFSGPDMLVLDGITLKSLHGQRTSLYPDGTPFTAGRTYVPGYSPSNAAETFYFNSGNRLVAKHSNLIGHQDTLQVKGFSWFYDCFVAGDVDFIWGNANAALFERCELRTRADTQGPSVVQARATSGFAGFVFLNSALTKDEGIYDAYLARSLNSGLDNVAFVSCSLDAHVDPSGWSVAGRYANVAPTAVTGWREYRSRQPGGDFVDLSGRVPAGIAGTWGSIQLSAADVGALFSSRATVFGCTSNLTIGWVGYGTTTGTCPGPSCTCSGWNPVP
jgi:pectin methylesterase-like acyl-CoA thioesterase